MKQLPQGLEQRSIFESYQQASQAKSDYVAVEMPIAFSYNGQSHAVMMASPIDLEDYAIGFSLTERIVDSIGDIVDIQIRKATQGITINIQIKAGLMPRLDAQRRQLSGRSSCGICGITELAAAIPKLPKMAIHSSPSHAAIERAIDSFTHNQPLQQLSGAVHAAALYSKNAEMVGLREDIGRHNALDKLIGGYTAKRTPQTGDFILMSSRASHELIVKAVLADVQTLVTLSAATSLAIDIAQKTNLNLIGFIRDSRHVIYHCSL